MLHHDLSSTSQFHGDHFLLPLVKDLFGPNKGTTVRYNGNKLSNDNQLTSPYLPFNLAPAVNNSSNRGMLYVAYPIGGMQLYGILCVRLHVGQIVLTLTSSSRSTSG